MPQKCEPGGDDPLDKSRLKDIKTKSFHKKWWAENAAKNCRGIGVEKAPDNCSKDSIGRDGLPNAVTDRKQADTASKSDDTLVKELNGAKSKCGKFQAETKTGIEKHFLPQIVVGRKQLLLFCWRMPKTKCEKRRTRTNSAGWAWMIKSRKVLVTN